jgi:hypothetical protein
MGAARDFDEVVAARRGVTFTLDERPWPLPLEMPHRALIYLDALVAEGGAGWIPTWKEMVALARHIWGDETVDDWLDAGVGVQRLSATVQWAVEQLSPKPGVTQEGP